MREKLTIFIILLVVGFTIYVLGYRSGSANAETTCIDTIIKWNQAADKRKEADAEFRLKNTEVLHNTITNLRLLNQPLEEKHD